MRCAQGAKTADQGVLQGNLSGSGLAAFGQMPAQKLTRMAIDDQSQRRPTVTTSPNSTEVSCPPLVRFVGF